VYQGASSALSDLIVGIIYGAAFAVTRRLWPVVLSHAAVNWIGFLLARS
jgi:membrane protease YdiL (CAAX protease family)